MAEGIKRKLPVPPVNGLTGTEMKEDKFEVDVEETDASLRCNLRGRYKLVIGDEDVALTPLDSRHPLFVWPFRFIRRFGVANTNIFKLEAGRRCTSGEGVFEFKHFNAQQIFETKKEKTTAFEQAQKYKQRPCLPPPTSSGHSVESDYSQPYGHMVSLCKKWDMEHNYANNPPKADATYPEQAAGIVDHGYVQPEPRDCKKAEYKKNQPNPACQSSDHFVESSLYQSIDGLKLDTGEQAENNKSYVGMKQPSKPRSEHCTPSIPGYMVMSGAKSKK